MYVHVYNSVLSFKSSISIFTPLFCSIDFLHYNKTLDFCMILTYVSTEQFCTIPNHKMLYFDLGLSPRSSCHDKHIDINFLEGVADYFAVWGSEGFFQINTWWNMKMGNRTLRETRLYVHVYMYIYIHLWHSQHHLPQRSGAPGSSLSCPSSNCSAQVAVWMPQQWMLSLPVAPPAHTKNQYVPRDDCNQKPPSKWALINTGYKELGVSFWWLHSFL